MGALSVSGRASDADSPLDDIPAGQDPAPVDDAAPADTGGDAPDLLPETAASRRERMWLERVQAHTKPLEERFQQETARYQQQLEAERQARQAQAEQLARLQGSLEEMRRGSQQQTQQQGPDPAELRRKSREALAAGNLDEYERLRDQAVDIVIERVADRKAEERVKAAREEWQRTYQPPVPQPLQKLLDSHPTVAQAGQEGFQMVLATAKRLPQTPDVLSKAFAKVEKFLSGDQSPATPPARPQFSQDSAAALSGIPTNRGASGAPGGDTGEPKLTQAQEAAFRAGGFKTRKEYLAWSDPHANGLLRGR